MTDGGVWIALITAGVPVMLSALGYALVQTVRYIKAQAKLEALYEQAKTTIEAKTREVEDVKEENAKLWALLEERTS